MFMLLAKYLATPAVTRHAPWVDDEESLDMWVDTLHLFQMFYEAQVATFNIDMVLAAATQNLRTTFAGNVLTRAPATLVGVGADENAPHTVFVNSPVGMLDLSLESYPHVMVSSDCALNDREFIALVLREFLPVACYFCWNSVEKNIVQYVGYFC